MKKISWKFICWMWNVALPSAAALFGLFYFAKLVRQNGRADEMGLFTSTCSLMAGTFICWAGVKLIQSLILRIAGRSDLFKAEPQVAIRHVEFYSGE